MFNLLFNKSYKNRILTVATLLLSFTSSYAQQNVLVHNNGPLVSYAMEVVIDGQGNTQGTISPLHKFTNVTLKRGVMSSRSDGGISATYDTLFSTDTEDGHQQRSNLQVQLETATVNDNGGGGEVTDILFDIVDGVEGQTESVFTGPDFETTTANDDSQGDGDGGGEVTDILFDIVDGIHQDSAVIVELFFEPASSTEQLSGEPAYLFNNPAPGELLRAVLPIPDSGETEISELRIQDADDSQNTAGNPGSTIQIRIKVEHEI